MAATNPNGANQHNPDPRQSLFLSYYLDPKSETFSNAYKSAIRAGYEDEYAKNITGQNTSWFSESIRDTYLLKKAEDNLSEFLEMQVTVNKDGIEITDAQLAKIKQDTTKFVAERLGKHKYSTRSEMTGKDGEPIQGNIIVFKDFNDKNKD